MMFARVKDEVPAAITDPESGAITPGQGRAVLMKLDGVRLVPTGEDVRVNNAAATAIAAAALVQLDLNRSNLGFGDPRPGYFVHAVLT